MQNVPRGYWTCDLCISSLSDFIAKEGRFPTNKDFGSWNNLPSVDAFKKCVGVRPQHYIRTHWQIKRQATWTRERCLSAIRAFVERTGSLPLTREFRRENGLPSQSSFFRAVGMTTSEYLRSLSRDIKGDPS